jgi:hypothetical protein
MKTLDVFEFLISIQPDDIPVTIDGSNYGVAIYGYIIAVILFTLILPR